MQIYLILFSICQLFGKPPFFIKFARLISVIPFFKPVDIKINIQNLKQNIKTFQHTTHGKNR